MTPIAYIIIYYLLCFMIQKYYTHYKNWEDWQNGMYRDVNNKQYYIQKSIECLRNPGKSMLKVIKEWNYSCKENLSDLSSNRKSWLGQAACCIEFKSPEHCTREAWGLLTKEERINANIIAEKIIRKWEESICPNLFSMLQENV